ncbi:MFS transporter [Gemmatimonas phototrophica]|uniref:Membrane protein n=1 Tax=Gemmatimonas phototrophica TaxID=1379270 RepID=A0A143BPK4_9BACT|nr:MFS transporter [Gemmatimonas phototrophica]AMW07017.1 membrane protein [Gemmatimonas phototrophica]
MTSPALPHHSSPSTDAAYARIAWRLLPLLFVCYIVAYLDRVNVGFAKLQMVTELRWSDATYGFGAGIFFVGYFLFEVPSNLLLERVGARRWIARIMITWALVSAAFAFVDVLPVGPLPGWFGLERTEFSFYALRLLLGMAEAGFFPGIVLYLTYWFPSTRRARAFAKFMTAVAVANVLGAPLSGWIMDTFNGSGGWSGWRWLFLLESAPSLVMGVLVLLFLPDGPAQARWLSESDRAQVLADLQGEREAAVHGGTAPRTARAALLNGTVWALAFVYFTMAVALYGVNFWMPTIIQELGLDRTAYLQIGLLSMIPWGVAGVTMLLWGGHSDRTGERRWHVTGGMVVTTVGLGLLAVTGTQVVPSLVALSLVAAGVLSSMSTFWAIPTNYLRGTAAAAGIAWINSIGNLGGHFGPDLIGRVRTATGSSAAAFLTLAALGVAGAVTVAVVARNERR